MIRAFIGTYHVTSDPDVFIDGYRNSVTGHWEHPDFLVIDGKLVHRSKVDVLDEMEDD